MNETYSAILVTILATAAVVFAVTLTVSFTLASFFFIKEQFFS